MNNLGSCLGGWCRITRACKSSIPMIADMRAVPARRGSITATRLTYGRSNVGSLANSLPWAASRVYKDGELVEWTTPGGAAHKTRALFCYLLLSGESGAQADRIGELIWPDQADETRKRARLHHAIAMLRKALGDKSSVLRAGEYYRLNAPQGSWTDISAFEQGCRRGLALAKAGRSRQALCASTARRSGNIMGDLVRRSAD